MPVAHRTRGRGGRARAGVAERHAPPRLSRFTLQGGRSGSGRRPISVLHSTSSPF